MPNITWYGPSSNRGEGSTGDRVSHTEPVVEAIKAKANDIARRAAFLLEARAKERTGDSQIKVKHHPRTYVDSVVYLEDPNGEKAATGINLHHKIFEDAIAGND